MEAELTTEQLRQIFLYTAQRIIDSEYCLTEIDLKLGDGDHGIAMASGFRAAIKNLSESELDSCEDVFRIVGNTLLDTMGGASGVLFGTMFISGIVRREEHRSIALQDLATIFRASLDALKKRGRAKIGDKTMVDAFEPAVAALEESVLAGSSLQHGMHVAELKAEEGLEYTKQCIARFGRAKSFGKKAIGIQDAGATSVYIIFRSMSEWITERANERGTEAL